MITSPIVKDAAVYRNMALSHRPLRQAAADQRIERMSRIEIDGKYDRDQNGLRRSRQGQVSGAMMTCQVATLAGDTLLIFWAMSGDGHQRRILVDDRGLAWMDTERGRAIQIGSNNKYHDVITKVLAARAH